MQLLLGGLLLAGQLSLPVTAAAQPVIPFYELVDTAAQRLATADPVAAFKWINGGPITDPRRADQVLDAVGGRRDRPRNRPAVRAAVFTDQIAATEGIEYTRFGQWKFDGSTAPTTAPDLSESRARDRRIQQDDGRGDCAALEFAAQRRLRAGSVGCDGRGGDDTPTRRPVPAGADVGDPVVLPTYLSSRDIRRSASTLPPVWQVGQY